MLRIHCANRSDIDAAWRLLTHWPDPNFQPAELHLDGFGPLYQVVREDGEQAALPATQLDHTPQPADHAAP